MAVPCRPFVPGSRQHRHCLIAAEVGQSHDGSLGQAHAFIDAAAQAGADAVKFQTHMAAAESTPAEPWRVHFSRQDASRYEYWTRMEFTEDQWCGLHDHAYENGLAFLSSPFSIEAMDLLERVGVSAWKVASGEIGNEAMLRRMARTGLPIILSTGMSGWDEIDSAVHQIKEAGGRVTVLQCTTAYPCPPERIGLNVINELRERYDCPVGLSDHSATIYAGLAAATLGIDVLEVHLTLSREMFGPDVASSLATDELRSLVDGVRFIELANAHPVSKDRTVAETTDLRAAFTKSVVARRQLVAGTALASDDLAVKKPGTGIPGSQLPMLIGRRVRRDLSADQLLEPDDVEPPL